MDKQGDIQKIIDICWDNIENLRKAQNNYEFLGENYKRCGDQIDIIFKILEEILEV